jgi:hypothetical protein
MIRVGSNNFRDGKSCFLLFRRSIPNDKYNIIP